MLVTVIVGYIPTEAGRAALEHGIAEARGRQVRLVVVSTQDKEQAPSAEAWARLSRELQRVGRRLTEEGVEHEIVKQELRGTAAESLVQAAEEMDAELLVIGLRRRSMVGKLLLGSQAQQIIMNAPCPVMSVRADAPAPRPSSR